MSNEWETVNEPLAELTKGYPPMNKPSEQKLKDLLAFYEMMKFKFDQNRLYDMLQQDENDPKRCYAWSDDELALGQSYISNIRILCNFLMHEYDYGLDNLADILDEVTMIELFGHDE